MIQADRQDAAFPTISGARWTHVQRIANMQPSQLDYILIVNLSVVKCFAEMTIISTNYCSSRH